MSSRQNAAGVALRPPQHLFRQRCFADGQQVLEARLYGVPVEKWRSVLAQFPETRATAILDDGTEVALQAGSYGYGHRPTRG